MPARDPTPEELNELSPTEESTLAEPGFFQTVTDPLLGFLPGPQGPGTAGMRRTLRGPDAPEFATLPEVRAMTEATLNAVSVPATGGLSLLPRIGAQSGIAAGISMATEGLDPSGPVPDVLLRAGLAGVGATVGELLPAGVGRLHQGRFGQLVSSRAAEAVQDLTKNARLALDRVSNGLTARIMGAVSRASITGRIIVRQAEQTSEEAASQVLDDLTEAFLRGGSAGEAADFIVDTLQNNRRSYFTAASAFYRRVDELSEGATVNINAVQESARQILSKVRSGSATSNKQSIGLLNEIIKRPNQIPYEEAANLRSDWLAIRRASRDLVANRPQRIAGVLAAKMDDALDAAGQAGTLQPAALEAKREADRIWREGAELFNNKVIKRILKTDPDRLGRFLTNNLTRRNARTLTRALREGEASQESIDALRGSFLEDILQRARTAEGQLRPQSVTRTINRLNDEALSELFGAQTRTVRRALSNLEVTAHELGSRGGLSLLIPAAEISAIGSGVLGLDLFTNLQNVAILSAGPATAKLMTNPNFVRWWTIGLKAQPGTEVAARAATQMVQSAIRAGATVHQVTTEEAQRMRAASGFLDRLGARPEGPAFRRRLPISFQNLLPPTDQ